MMQLGTDESGRWRNGEFVKKQIQEKKLLFS
jgi:hypothetical protein